jgi:DUF4097 and DUF4098 domain-containing protein YvlB
MKPSSFAALAAASTIFASTLSAQRSTGDTFTWTGAMSQGSTLVIRNINGPVSVQRATGNQAEVTAVKKYTRGDAARVVVEAVRYGAQNENAMVCAMWNPEAKCASNGQSGGTSDSAGDVAVTFTVRIPAGVNAQLHTVNGRIDVAGVTGSIQASTVNGSIVAAGTGSIVASTVSGNVDATIAAAGGTQNIDLKTVNGSVSAAAPTGLNAVVSASTINGGIESDFPLTVQGRIGMRSVNGTLGSGGRRINMTTINGNVILKKN